MSIPANLQRKPFLAPIGVVAAAAIAALLGLLIVAWFLITAKSTTILVVRHAETVAVDADAPLSGAGEARARTLASMLGDSRLHEHIDAIYVSPSAHDRATAAPLAQRLGLTPIVTAEDDPRALAHRVIHEHRGGRIVIVADGPDIPPIIAALSGVGPVPPVAEGDYGTLYIVTAPRIGRANLLSIDY